MIKKQVFYELNARQFSDRTNTGVGDFAGLSTKIDYFDYLGIDAIIFQNVLAINEVDQVQNYTSITKSLGDINEFKRVISLLKNKGIKTVIELGIGTIKENHKWFQYAINQGQEEFKSIINFKPNDLDADKTQTLKYSPENKSYYLIDEQTEEVPLNWLSDQVIERFIKIVKFWNEIGVDGFTFKGFEYLADETKQTEMGEDTLKQLRKFYRAIKEINDDIIVIGRSSKIELSDSLSLTKDETQVFDYFISDQIFKLGSSRKYGMDEIGKFRPRELGKILREYANHPSQIIAFAHPSTGRVNSRWGSNGQYQYQSAKSIAIPLLAAPASALIYYGDELGVFNIGLTHLDDFQDETLEARKRELENTGLKNRAFMAAQVMQNPINSRSLMPWTDEKNGGFSYEDKTITPVNVDYKEVNVAAQYKDVSSPLSFYKMLINMFTHDMTDSEYEEYVDSFKASITLSSVIKYSFKFGTKKYTVLTNLSPKVKKVRTSRYGKVVAQTYFHKAYRTVPQVLNAYESVVIEEMTESEQTKTIEFGVNQEVALYKDKLVQDMDKKHGEVLQVLTNELTSAQLKAEEKRAEYENAKKERKAMEQKKQEILNEVISEKDALDILVTAKAEATKEELKALEKTSTIQIIEIDKEREQIIKDIDAENVKIEKIKEKAKIEMAEKMKAAEDAIFAELGNDRSKLTEDQIAYTTILEDDEELEFN